MSESKAKERKGEAPQLVGAGGEAIKSDKPLGKIIFKPMPGKVACRVVGEREHYGRSGLIVRPVTNRRPRTTAVVIAVYEPFTDYGDKEESVPFVEVGDTVVFGMHAGVEVEYGDETVIILREQEILTKVVVESPEDAKHIGVAAGPLDDVEG